MKMPSSIPEAAVLIIIFAERGEEKILLTKRSELLRDHAGEVAFPGGKRDHEDENLYQTALRECEEEVGVSSDCLHWQAELPMHQTRLGARVTPFVAHLAGEPKLKLNKAEIESAFWVPVSLFAEDQRAKTLVFRSSGQEYWAPVYHYQQYEIWGFTARVLVNFVNRCYGKSLKRYHASAPELVY